MRSRGHCEICCQPTYCGPQIGPALERPLYERHERPELVPLPKTKDKDKLFRDKDKFIEETPEEAQYHSRGTLFIVNGMYYVADGVGWLHPGTVPPPLPEVVQTTAR
jgi:hypothetical protein